MVDRNYRLLGIMWKQNRQFLEDIRNYRSIKGFMENEKRVIYNKKPENVRMVFRNIFDYVVHVGRTMV